MEIEQSVKSFIGWVLLVVGIFILFWTIMNSYNMFTDRQDFPGLFESSASQTSSQTSQGDSVEDMIQDQIQSLMSEQFSSIIPSGAITDMLNMTAWIIFATFMVYAGAKVAGLGASMIRREG